MKYRILPFLAFILLFAVLGYRLFLVEKGQRPDFLPSALIGKKAPSFFLPDLLQEGQSVSLDLCQGKPVLVNFFASWCRPCLAEHRFLMELGKDQEICMIGVDYKDREGEKWIGRLGNPYQAIGVDLDGSVAIDFGVYGVPESYILDRNLIVRHRRVGALDQDIWQSEIRPLLENLAHE